MEYTNLDYFNYYLKEFCNEITTNYPDFEKVVVSNYRDLLEGRANKNDLYVKYFISKVNDHMDAICSGDVELFNPQNYIDSETGNVRGLYLLEGVDFIKLWSSEHNNDKNKEAVLKYLKLLTVIGRKIVPNNKEILDLLENVGGQVSAPAKVEKTLYGEEEDLDDAGNEPDILGLGSISGLAGLAGLGSGEMPDIGKLAKTLTESLSKIKIPNMEEMQEELKKNNLNNNESNDEQNNDSTNGDSTNNNEENNNETSEPTEEGKVRNNLNNEDENGPVDESESDSPEAPDLANGTSNLFTDLAQEMASTFDFDNIEKDGQPENMGEAFGKFMSGNNPTKLMGLVSKFGNRLQTDISSGKVNHQDLLKDTTSMMQGLQDGIKNPNNLKKQAKKMAKNNPKMMAQMQQMQKNMQNNSGNTKDRLRAKLEARKATAAKESTSAAPAST